MHIRKVRLLVLFSLFTSGAVFGVEAIPNWPAPALWSPPRARGATTLSETNPLFFVAVTPCRVADTRGNGFTGSWGPPSLAANATRTFPIGGQCGIPASATAVSFNFAALNVGGTGDLRVFPAGGTVPLVSTLNYNASTPNIANAAVVALGSGSITVQADAVSVDLIIDVNGYYPAQFADLTPGQFVILHGSVSGSLLGALNADTSGGAVAIFGLVFGPASTAGVNGISVPPVTISGSRATAGVRGESRDSFGVLGLSNYVGVVGSYYDTAGTLTAEGYLGSNFGPQAGGPPWGAFSYGNFGATGTKFFVEPHPDDPSKVIRYASLEGPEAGTYFRGTGRTVRGRAVIAVPEDFRIVTDEEGMTVQLTPVGSLTAMAVESEDLTRIVVRSSQDVVFHYLVQGVRRAFNDLKPVGAGNEFVPRSAEDRMPACLTEEARRRLIANGTYNADGTVNRETADRLGWTSAWKGRDERTRAEADAASAAWRARQRP